MSNAIIFSDQVLSRIELVNSIVALLSIDFHALEQDVKKEQQLRQKVRIFTHSKSSVSEPDLFLHFIWLPARYRHRNPFRKG